MCAISSLTSTFAISSPDEFLFFSGDSEANWTENSRSSSVLKIDIPSVIDVIKTSLPANEKLTNQHF